MLTCTNAGESGSLRLEMSLPLHPAEEMPEWRRDEQIRKLVEFALGEEHASKVGRSFYYFLPFEHCAL